MWTLHCGMQAFLPVVCGLLRVRALKGAGSSLQHAGSLVALSGFSCPEACGILVPNQGSTCICCIGRQIVTPLDYQGSPSAVFFVRTLFGKENRSFIKLSLWSSQRLSVSYLLNVSMY